MNCSNCGQPLSPGAVFCGNCGAQVPQPTLPPAQPAATTAAPTQPILGQPQPTSQPVPQAPYPTPAPTAMPAQYTQPLTNTGSALWLLIANSITLILVIASFFSDIIAGISFVATIGFGVTTIILRKKRKQKYIQPAFMIINIAAAIWIVTLILGFALGFKSGFDDAKNKSTNQTSSVSETSKPTRSYPQDERTAFISSCVEAGSSGSRCECFLKSLESVLTYEEFLEGDMQTRRREPTSVKFRQALDRTSADCPQ